MAYFFKNNNRYSVSSDSSDISQILPPGNYVIKVDPMSGFYLEISEDFTLPSKIYGDCLTHTNRILNTFKKRNKNTGVLLVGEKGSGKTLLMRNIGIQSGLPVFIINEPFVGDNFFSFLTSIVQPSIVLFDEFEKVYGDKQHSVLTLLDGTYQSNKLFIFSSNNKWQLDSNMQNRPGRIYYMLEYSSISEDFIREYCEDNLINKKKLEGIVDVSRMFDNFNFDMLCSLVEEVNRYDESPYELTKILNVRPEYQEGSYYKPSIILGKNVITTKYLGRQNVGLNPYRHFCNLHFPICWNTNQSQETLDEIQDAIDENDLPVITKLLDHNKVFLGSMNNNIPDEDCEYDDVEVTGRPDDINKCDKNGLSYDLDHNCFITLQNI